LKAVTRVDMLIVHGMGSPTEGYSDQMVRRIAEDLMLTRVGDVDRTVLDRHKRPETAGVVRVTTYRSANARILRVHEVTWAPVINRIKHDMLAYDATSPASKLRDTLNGALKRDLINERLADPVLYLGAQQDEIQYPVKYTVCRMIGGRMVANACTPGGGDDLPLRMIIVTQSLGSRITFDSIMEVREEVGIAGREPVDELAKRTSEVYMLANQLPLLELADVAPPSAQPNESGRPSGGLAGFLRVRRSGPETGMRLAIVALTDPNDLLSYTISDTFMRRFNEVTFINVDVGVSGIGLFRLVANPLKAHVGHENDGRVINLIARGIERPTDPQDEAPIR
jgi:hypothetical protein